MKEGKEQIRRTGVLGGGDFLFLHHNCRGEALDIGRPGEATRQLLPPVWGLYGGLHLKVMIQEEGTLIETVQHSKAYGPIVHKMYKDYERVKVVIVH